MKSDEKYLEVKENEALYLFLNNTPVTITDVYYTLDEMNGEKKIIDVVSCYMDYCNTERVVKWKSSAEEAVYLDEIGSDMFVQTKYYVHTDDVVLN